MYGASESELTIAQQFLDRCFKRRYISKKLEIGELLKVQGHRICSKVSSIPNHPLRATQQIRGCKLTPRVIYINISVIITLAECFLKDTPIQCMKTLKWCNQEMWHTLAV